MELVLTVPADVRAPRMARGALSVLDPVFPPAFVEDVRLLTNELVTNAIRHGGLRPSDEVEVWAGGSEEGLRVEVVGGKRRFHLRASGSNPQRSSGWGLLLVGALSNRWGYRDGGATAVWFEINRTRRLSTEPLPPELDAPLAGWLGLRPRRRAPRAS